MAIRTKIDLSGNETEASRMQDMFKLRTNYMSIMLDHCTRFLDTDSTKVVAFERAVAWEGSTLFYTQYGWISCNIILWFAKTEGSLIFNRLKTRTTISLFVVLSHGDYGLISWGIRRSRLEFRFRTPRHELVIHARLDDQPSLPSSRERGRNAQPV